MKMKIIKKFGIECYKFSDIKKEILKTDTRMWVKRFEDFLRKEEVLKLNEKGERLVYKRLWEKYKNLK